jgi:arylformamidase
VSRIIDISPVLSSATAVWPGDVRFSRVVSLDMKKGDNLTLSAITTTLHVGAHADAPSHYGRHGVGIGERDLELYYGPCDVVHVNVARGERISSGHLAGACITSPRVLLRTGTFPDPNTFNTDFASLSPELVHYLAARGVRLIGIDTPSVDPFADRELLAHNAVQVHDMAVLETIVLGHVAAGTYTLIALPLRLADGDASPVRAVLVQSGQ